MQRVPMTPAGYAALAAELKYNKETLRLQIVRDIEEARAHGDISENSEFEDAKHRQSLCEGRIRELEAKLAAAEVIDVTRLEAADRVIFGVTVKVEDLDSGEEFTYRIVGTDEADVKQGLISVTSPIGRALVGKETGDEVKFEAPGGMRRFAISEVLYK
ncbi:MAG: transcription elongation factor GreA [Pseudomonadota bacterium]